MMKEKIQQLFDAKMKAGMSQDEAIAWVAKSLDLTISDVVALANGSESTDQAERDSYIPGDLDQQGVVEKMVRDYPGIAKSPELWNNTAQEVERIALERYKKDGTDPSISKGSWDIYDQAAKNITNREAIKDYKRSGSE